MATNKHFPNHCPNCATGIMQAAVMMEEGVEYEIKTCDKCPYWC